MEILERVFNWMLPGLPTGAALLATILILLVVRFILNRKYAGALELRFRRQIVTMILSFIGILAIIIVLPISDTLRGQLLTLFGILLSAAIALSSTTLLGNAMAGMMLRAVRNFKPGDFVTVGEHFGRVSDRGLFHVEIQTEDRDLTTVPNLYLVTNPVKVTRASGTIVSATVSLGYDVPHRKIESSLLEAAGEAGLQDPFVHILELGDFSVTYRVAGLLTEVKQLLSTRSNLKEQMLDKLHLAGIEIVSPTFMNTRAQPEGRVFIPAVQREPFVEDPESSKTPETVVFDKAEKAESLEKLREMHEQLGADIEVLKEKTEDAKSDETKRDSLKAELSRLEVRRAGLANIIKIREEAKKE